eukprot:292322-Chlamydomonas_euryale.AAC.7
MERPNVHRVDHNIYVRTAGIGAAGSSSCITVHFWEILDVLVIKICNFPQKYTATCNCRYNLQLSNVSVCWHVVTKIAVSPYWPLTRAIVGCADNITCLGKPLEQTTRNRLVLLQARKKNVEPAGLSVKMTHKVPNLVQQSEGST